MPDPISDKQLAANRANASRSTGPRTPQGKVRSARNARKHGFAGTDFAIVKIEEREAVDRLRDDLITVYQPANSQETFAVERIALAQHTLLRLARLESGLCTVALNRALLSFESETPFVPLHEELHVNPEEIKAQNRCYYFAQGFHRMNIENSATWGLFLRYQAQFERQYRRAIEEFERLKALRGKLQNEAIFEPQPEENPSTSASENEPIFIPEAPSPAGNAV